MCFYWKIFKFEVVAVTLHPGSDCFPNTAHPQCFFLLCIFPIPASLSKNIYGQQTACLVSDLIHYFAFREDTSSNMGLTRIGFELVFLFGLIQWARHYMKALYCTSYLCVCGLNSSASAASLSLAQ